MDNTPASLKALKPYLQHAKQMTKLDPLIAYYCKCYAVQLGVESNPPNDAKGFLLSLLDQLDNEKKTLGSKLESENSGSQYVTQFATKIFDKADVQDREGNATKATARTFYAATIFFNILKQFGELDEDIQEKLKYAKWKAADINTALREGRTPLPGPAFDLNDEESSEFSSNPVSSTQSEPQFEIQSRQPEVHQFNQESYSNPQISISSSFQIDEMKFPSPPTQPIETESFSDSQFSNQQNYSEYEFYTQQNNVGQPSYQNITNNSQSSQISNDSHYSSDSDATPNEFNQRFSQTSTNHFQQPPPPQFESNQQAPPPQFESNQQWNHYTQYNQSTPQQYQQYQPNVQTNIYQAPSPPVHQQQNTRYSAPAQNHYSMGDTSTQMSPDQALRFARFSVSALQFEDVPTAINNLKRSLANLGVHVP